MVPVACGTCGAQVLVRKSSWEQTSVQWDRTSMSQCLERGKAQEQPSQAGFSAAALRPGMFLVCAQLRASIEEGVSTGSLRILDEL